MMHIWIITIIFHVYIVPMISSVVMRSSKDNPLVTVGSAVTLTCTVELGPAVVDSDLSMLVVDVQFSRDGTTLALTGPTVTGTTFTNTIMLNSFEWNDSGNYNCTATVRPQSTSMYLTGSAVLGSETIYIQAGSYIYITV